MILCNMESVVIPRPPTLPPSSPLPLNKLGSSRNSQGFRLMDDQCETGSIYSIYKQKIDQMFETSDSSSTQNVIQARIEKMFTDVAKDNGIVVRNDDIGQHNFSVDYLGSVPLQEKVSSLSGLQNPLKQLYFAYKKTTKCKKQLTGRLEISSQGLKVQYQGERGDLEQLNSFPTIAVWSAVKFVIDDIKRYAFLPLITDPDNIDKKSLFRPLDHNEKKYINASQAHSPLFAVVMRKIGVQKQLECHGFVCQTSEDAIVIAATLYKSLMAHMKAKEKKPKCRNGITCMSITSSSPNEKTSPKIPIRPPRKKRSTTSSIISANDLDDIDTQLLLQTKKMPKKSIKTKRAPTVPDKQADFDAILPYEEPLKIEEKSKSFSDKISTIMSREQKQLAEEMKQVISEGPNLKKIDDTTPARKKENSGDILTKVTIPRSGSFLNAGGLTRYKSKVSRSNGQLTGGSPLGFNELFNEFRLQEGLHSVDEILGVIIDPEGMSFNDLKPIYKEFLLKLSVTLTKDELYQRSKLIMKRHRKKMLRKNNGNKGHHKLVGNRIKRLKHIFQKKLKPTKNQTNTQNNYQKVPLESSISTSSYDTRQFTPKNGNFSKKLEKKDNRISTSEDSDFFSIRRKSSAILNQNRNSSSGYVSCSECSYDSDSCTCTSADKCYCSLGQNTPKTHQIKAKCYCHNETVFCGCDTDSCTESNKCYCQLKGDKHKKLCKKYSNTRSTRSLEYMHNPSEAYYEKLKGKRRKFSTDSVPVEYELFKIQKNLGNRAIYSKANDRPASLRYSSVKYGVNAKTAPNGACLETLSVKKSAEIAALFADIKLSRSEPNRNIYNKLKTHEMQAVGHPRMVQNAIYRNSRNLFNARNGLYTIQSQSDESRRSSLSDEKKRDFYEFRQTNLENSLGYLP